MADLKDEWKVIGYKSLIMAARSKTCLVMRACKPTLRHFKIVLVIVLLFIVYVGYQIYDDKVTFVFSHTGSDTPCVLPELDPFDPKMMEYIWRPDPIVCENPAVVYVGRNNTLQYNLTAMHLLNEKADRVKCEIYYIKRVQDDAIEFENPFPWKPPEPILEDFFRVKCVGSSGTLFDNTLARIQKKDRELFDLKKALAEDKYNLLMFGIDSLSRSSAIRQLPLTYKYLQTLGAFDMKGYMKVASDTLVNIAPLLSGFFLHELPNVKLLEDFLDDLPLIWRNFTNEKSATLFAEDLPNLGMFNMDKRGFLHSPTDHFMRPFWLANFKLMPMHNLRTHVSRILEHSNMKLSKTSALCLADTPNHVVVMNYIKQFMLTYKHQRKFSFSFLTELSHEFQNLLQLGDEDLLHFFQWLNEEGFLDDTILVVFSDHGLKFGNNQHLFVARMENRMPILNIVPPKSLKQKYPNIVKSLTVNQERLASTFDMHATLRDIFSGNYKNPSTFKVDDKLRGISLFRELPEVRSCADASINEAFCACYKSTKLNITGNPLADTMAKAVVDHINGLLHGHDECETVKLHGITELRKIEQGLKHSQTQRKKNMWFMPKSVQAETREDVRHVIVFETQPGHARYYATCDVINNSIDVFGTVDRINKYGNTSHCVDKHELRPYCYCKKQL